jgi:L-ascorbate metabolism protein UlaG (beta-lactamase superfamily)
MLPIHWGTYKLTDEPLDEPPARLDDWRAAQRLEPERVLTLPLGGLVPW